MKFTFNILNCYLPIIGSEPYRFKRNDKMYTEYVSFTLFEKIEFNHPNSLFISISSIVYHKVKSIHVDTYPYITKLLHVSPNVWNNWFTPATEESIHKIRQFLFLLIIQFYFSILYHYLSSLLQIRWLTLKPEKSK